MDIASYIEVRNSSNQRTAYITPEDGIKGCFIDTNLSGESTLEFYLPSTSDKIDKLTPECKLIVDNKVFILLKDDAIDIVRDEKNTLWSKVMAVESWYELDTKFPEPYINNDTTIDNPVDLTVTIVGGGSNLSGGLYTVGTAPHALYALLEDTGWSLGTVDVSGTHDLETEKVSILANIKQVQETWGGNLVFDSENKTVSLRDELLWQNYTGFQVRYKKNLKHITRTQSNKIITKLYPFGKDSLDIASVNSGVKYIQNHSYSSFDYVGIYENQDINDAQELKNEAVTYLARNCSPRYLYRIKVVDLRTLQEYSHEDFSLGDMVDVIDDGININTKQRIIRYKYEVFNPWNCELEIGDPQDRFFDKLKSSFSTSDTISSASNSKNQIAGSYIQSISADKITAGTITATIDLTAPNIYGGNIEIGSGNSIFKADSNGIYLGNAAFNQAPFKVDMNGNLVATSATISGNITMTSGSISWSTISAPSYSQIEGTKPPDNADNTIGAIGSTYLTKITSTGIYTGTINANQVNAGTLSGFTINGSVINISEEGVIYIPYTNGYASIGNAGIYSFNSLGGYNGVCIPMNGTDIGVELHRNDTKISEYFYSSSENRVWLRTLNNYKIKISSADDMSIEVPSNKTIYFGGILDFNATTITGLSVCFA